MHKNKHSGELGEGPGPPLSYFGIKKEEMTEGGKAGWARKIELGRLWIRH